MSKKADAPPEVSSLGNGRYQVVNGMKRLVAYAVAGRDVWVFVDGRAYTIGDASGGPPRKSGIDDEAALTAPMPATVLAINVTPGQRVERNDVVMILEAMKMELPVRVPRDGVIKAVACQVGELVQPGATLLQLEEPTEDVGNERIER